jgi:hypothetical protein
MPRHRGRKKQSRYADATTETGRKAQGEAAFAAIRALYCEALPLWLSCSRGQCRRHQACSGDGHTCLKRAWPLMPRDVQDKTFALVQRGGSRRLRPATRRESELRTFSPTNFVL